MMRPFPWFCPRCRKKDVWRSTVSYQCQRMHHGVSVDVVVPDLDVPRCASCGELVFDYYAEEQINEAFGKRVSCGVRSQPECSRHSANGSVKRAWACGSA